MDQYEKIETIGSGAFGKVCKIRRKSDNKILVWKELNYGAMNEQEKQQLVSEVSYNIEQNSNVLCVCVYVCVNIVIVIVNECVDDLTCLDLTWLLL